jgi:hypothetical protein
VFAFALAVAVPDHQQTSTETVHSLIVNRIGEKPALGEVEWNPRISPLPLPLFF